MHISLTPSCPIYDSFRVAQIAGMFDVPLAERATETFEADLPDLTDKWQIGLIVGPSGSGKTNVARHAFGASLVAPAEWPADRAVIDAFDQFPRTHHAPRDVLSTHDIIGLFTAVGFSSPPSWIKPYHVLSTGEQFRCNLARALAFGLAPKLQLPLVVFDEFTSVVDRTVARIASAALAKSLRSGRLACRFVAVTCHRDVTKWLTPDWILDMATGRLTWRRLRRPPIALAIHRCRRDAWSLFKRHHYLSGQLGRGARCYLATWISRRGLTQLIGTPVAFCATLSMIGRKDHWRISRLVTLPDYQGIGIGSAVLNGVAELHAAEGHRINLTARHPALLAHCAHSSRWRLVCIKKTGSATARPFIDNYRASTGRPVVSFEYQ